MIPITIIVRGMESEPIDAVKVGAIQDNGDKIYFIQTVDGRVASVKEDDIVVYWENNPSSEMLKSIDKMIETGNVLMHKKKAEYNGAEVQ